MTTRLKKRIFIVILCFTFLFQFNINEYNTAKADGGTIQNLSKFTGDVLRDALIGLTLILTGVTYANWDLTKAVGKQMWKEWTESGGDTSIIDTFEGTVNMTDEYRNFLAHQTINLPNTIPLETIEEGVLYTTTDRLNISNSSPTMVNMANTLHVNANDILKISVDFVQYNSSENKVNFPSTYIAYPRLAKDGSFYGWTSQEVKDYVISGNTVTYTMQMLSVPADGLLNRVGLKAQNSDYGVAINQIRLNKTATVETDISAIKTHVLSQEENLARLNKMLEGNTTKTITFNKELDYMGTNIDNLENKIGGITSGIENNTGVLEGIKGILENWKDSILTVPTAIQNVITKIGDVATTIGNAIGNVAEKIISLPGAIAQSIGDFIKARTDDIRHSPNLPDLLGLLILIMIALIRLLLACINFILSMRGIPANPAFFNANIVKGIDFTKNMRIPVFNLSFYNVILSVVFILSLLRVVKIIRRAIEKEFG